MQWGQCKDQAEIPTQIGSKQSEESKELQKAQGIKQTKHLSYPPSLSQAKESGWKKKETNVGMEGVSLEVSLLEFGRQLS